MSKTRISPTLRKIVVDRAQNCCEYCLMPNIFSLVAFEVDHVIAEKHGGETTVENLALSCATCNQHKGSDIASVDPETGEIVPLYHPRNQAWSQHFKVINAQIMPLTANARVTIRLLRFNDPERIAERALFLKAQED